MAQGLQPDPVPGGQGPLEARVEPHGEEEGPEGPPGPFLRLFRRRRPEDEGACDEGEKARQGQKGGVGERAQGQGGEDRPQAEGHVDPVQKLHPPFRVKLPHEAVPVDVHHPLP